jgi:hypothetical protein
MNTPEDKIRTVAPVEIEVTQLDGSKETVKVRQIPLSKIQQFVVCLSEEAGAIALYCDRPKEWADTLTPESANTVLDKGQELNLPFLSAWFRRQAKWRESQAVGVTADLEKKIQEIIAVSLAVNSQQQSPTATG